MPVINRQDLVDNPKIKAELTELLKMINRMPISTHRHDLDRDMYEDGILDLDHAREAYNNPDEFCTQRSSNLKVILTRPELAETTEDAQLISTFNRRTKYIIGLLAVAFPKTSIRMTGKFIYPEEQGYMGWHTNINDAGIRLYFTHTNEADKSQFKWYDPNLDAIHESADEGGWMCRQFDIDVDDVLAHAVYSETRRISIGFNIRPL